MNKPEDFTIRHATREDAESVANIYNHYIDHTFISFEETHVSPDAMWGRMSETAAAIDYPWLVLGSGSQVLGYAYASPWKGRCAYSRSVESSVYLAHEATGKGMGSQLYKRLFAGLTSRSFHTVIAGIALPNAASVALHEKFGFQKTAHFKQVGRKFDQWIDVGYWQLMLESPNVECS